MADRPAFKTNREQCTHCIYGEMWTPEFHRLGADCKHPEAASWPHMQTWSDGTVSIRPEAPLCQHFVLRDDDQMRQLDIING